MTTPLAPAQTPPDAGLSRREMLQMLGAGLVIAVTGPDDADAQERRTGQGGGTGRNSQQITIAARLHIGRDGLITVMSGKVECGQGARAQITQAAAEELHVPTTSIRVILGDTELCPDDGPTVGSFTTPRTIPAVRAAAGAARDLLLGLAAVRWDVGKDLLEARDGKVVHPASGRQATYADLAGDDWARTAAITPPSNVHVTAVENWRVLGTTEPRPNGRDIVVGTHRYPSDIVRPNMLVGKILRAPAIGSKLIDIDLTAAEKLKDVVVTRSGDFVGVAAPKAHTARRAVELLRATAKYEHVPQVSSPALFEHLRRTAKEPAKLSSPYAEEMKGAAKSLRAEYRVAYVQHAPLEPRAAVAEWEGDKVTVWTGTQIPSRVKSQLQEAFKISAANVRVIVPDFGGGFGGKHTGEHAVEAARLAKAAGRPVKLQWTREEEFTWAYFRPAALILTEAGLDAAGKITNWSHVNVNSGGQGLESPYHGSKKYAPFVESTAAPLRHGSYRALAATANHFAREVFIDELAHAAGVDPLTFRLKNLDAGRMVDVLKAAADGIGWNAPRSLMPGVGYGLACGTEKASFVAAAVRVQVDPRTRKITVTDVCQAYECGKIMNPGNLLAQVQGAIVQGLGPALWEEILLDDGRVTTNSFGRYYVPHFTDLPRIDVKLLDRPDLPSVGGSETPIIVVAPAIANAVFMATGERVRTMPIRLAPAPPSPTAASGV